MDDALHYLAITRLQARYGDAVTRRAWDELIPMFTPDCPVRLDLHTGSVIEHVGPAAIGSFIATSIERFDFFAFTIVNSVVDVEADGVRATGRLYIRELRNERATQQWSTAYGLYRDTYVRGSQGWRFASRDYSSLARTATGRDGMDVFEIPGAVRGSDHS
jgi:hypothetical protein